MTDKPPATCSINACKAKPSVPLRSQPPATKENPENLWWFCAEHASKYEVPYIVDATTGCWLWQRAILRSGYGQMYDPAAGKVRLAHRVYYEREFGPLPEGMQLDHVRARGCVHRHCVNPAHLEPVTNAENIQRGRTAKLTADDVRVIRASTETSRPLARRFGVHPTLIQQVRARRIWKNVA